MCRLPATAAVSETTAMEVLQTDSYEDFVTRMESQVHDAIIGDTVITERQKQVLLDIYTSFCQQNEAAREELSTE